MILKGNCPECGSRYELPAKALDQESECTECKGTFMITKKNPLKPRRIKCSPKLRKKEKVARRYRRWPGAVATLCGLLLIGGLMWFISGESETETAARTKTVKNVSRAVTQSRELIQQREFDKAVFVLDQARQSLLHADDATEEMRRRIRRAFDELEQARQRTPAQTIPRREE